MTSAANAPVANAPVAIAPVANAPVAIAPVAIAPVANAPVAIAPVAIAPVAIAPVAIAPVAIAPVAIAPAANAPAAIAPAAIAPAANAPAAIAPPAIAALAIVRAPRTSASDDTLKLVGVLVADGESIVAGQLLFEVEGAKAVSEIAAESSGTVFLAASRGAQVSCGAPLAVIAPPGTPREAALAALAAPPSAPDETLSSEPAACVATATGARFTNAAAALLEQYGLPAALFAGHGLVTSSTVRAYREQQPAAPEQHLAPPARGGNGRVVLVGGGYGANQVLSVLLFEAGTTVVGILDDDQRKHGQRIKGVEILGPTTLLERLAGENAVDAAICSIGGNIAARVAVHEAAHRAGLRLANAIHPTAAFDDGALIGSGNFFGAFCYIGCDTTIGDNCFFSSRTTIEHHNTVGDHITTGPNCATSGVVTIGSCVKFGTGIVVEPRLSIGSGSTIASNVAISVDIPANVVVKSRVNIRW